MMRFVVSDKGELLFWQCSKARPGCTNVSVFYWPVVCLNGLRGACEPHRTVKISRPKAFRLPLETLLKGFPKGNEMPHQQAGGDSTPLWEVQCLSAMMPWHPDCHASATSPSLFRDDQNLRNNCVTVQWRRAGCRASPYRHPGCHANVVPPG